jgi:hypothetical protein
MNAENLGTLLNLCTTQAGLRNRSATDCLIQQDNMRDHIISFGIKLLYEFNGTPRNFNQIRISVKSSGIEMEKIKNLIKLKHTGEFYQENRKD